MILEECKSDYIVKYYGSYFKDEFLWIVMEYCAAGSIGDLIRICERVDGMIFRNCERKK